MRNFNAVDTLAAFDQAAAASPYDAVDLRLACVREGVGHRIVVATATGVLDSSAKASKFYRYEQLTIWRGSISMTALRGALESLPTGTELTLPNIGDVVAKANWQLNAQYGSLDENFWAESGWFTRYLQAWLEVSPETDQLLKVQDRLSGDGPLYPSAMTAMFRELFDITPPLGSECTRHFHVALPDYRAAFSAVNVRDAAVDIETKQGPWFKGEQLYVQRYIDAEGEVPQDPTPVQNGRLHLDAPRAIKEVVFQLISQDRVVFDEFQRGYFAPVSVPDSSPAEPSLALSQPESPVVAGFTSPPRAREIDAGAVEVQHDVPPRSSSEERRYRGRVGRQNDKTQLAAVDGRTPEDLRRKPDKRTLEAVGG